MRGHYAQRSIAHGIDTVLLDQVAGADELDAVCRRPPGERRGHLRLRERGPDDVGRASGDRRAGRIHDDRRDLALGHQRSGRKRIGREVEARDE